MTSAINDLFKYKFQRNAKSVEPLLNFLQSDYMLGFFAVEMNGCIAILANSLLAVQHYSSSSVNIQEYTNNETRILFSMMNIGCVLRTKGPSDFYER